MRIKNDMVKIGGARPELIFAMVVASDVYKDYGFDFVITSITDGKHSATSLHYAGCAFDCRIYDGDMTVVVKEIKRRLGGDYDVILEGNHIHLEFQPRY